MCAKSRLAGVRAGTATGARRYAGARHHCGAINSPPGTNIGAWILLAPKEQRIKGRLRRGLPKFLKCNSNLIFIIKRLGRRPKRHRYARSAQRCVRSSRKWRTICRIAKCRRWPLVRIWNDTAKPRDIPDSLSCVRGSTDHGRSFQGHLAAHSAPTVGRLRGRACRMRATLSRAFLPVGPRSCRGYILPGRFGRADLPAGSGFAGSSVRSRLRVPTISPENHRPRRIFTPES
jgi:hypothetical protein